MSSRWDEWYNVDKFGNTWTALDENGFCMCCEGGFQVKCLSCKGNEGPCRECVGTGWVTCGVCGGSGTG